MMMTADMKKVLDFVKQVETTDDPEQIVNLCIEHGFGVIKTPGYDMFANCTEEEKREWYVFLLFLVKYDGAKVDGGVEQYIEWAIEPHRSGDAGQASRRYPQPDSDGHA